MLERQIRLYEWLLHHLQDLPDSIGILSTGHLPPELFPPYSPAECYCKCH